MTTWFKVSAKDTKSFKRIGYSYAGFLKTYLIDYPILLFHVSKGLTFSYSLKRAEIILYALCWFVALDTSKYACNFLHLHVL